jgi:hypothetical protein
MTTNNANVVGVMMAPEYATAENVKTVVNRPIDPSLIKSRDISGKTFRYISGSTVINLLDEAFGMKWSYEVLSKEIVIAEPKPMKRWNEVTRKTEFVKDKNGNIVMENQPPYVEVLGRLTVPGWGVKEQYGSQALIGGTSEQMSACKGAATDALKKCATMFGIGAELYEDVTLDEKEEYPKAQQNTNWKKPSAPAPAPKLPGATTSNTPSVQFDAHCKDKLKALKADFGITDNEQLNPYVVEFTNNPDATWKDIVPTNIAAFNTFFEGKKPKK